MAGWVRRAENKAKAQQSTDIIPGKLIAELQHSAWLSKTFPDGWVAGWLAGWLDLSEKKANLSLKLSWKFS